MRRRLLLPLFLCILFSAPASAFSTSSSILSYPLTDSTEASGKNVTELPKSKKVGFFKKIRNAVVGFIVKMHITKANKKNSPLVFALVSIGLLIAGLALLFSSGGGGHAVGSLAGLGFGLILLALIFAIVYSVKRRSLKKSKKE